ncbi:AraC family transcriptional regulator [Gallaecimonas sp. GXIMD4217]|uniref:AraC family transcriptional regulator n=1 Tax=Gallaecimonas sp. GXIMD4217 TaxID=3131927 RepID=UPI00311B21C9
MPTRFEKVLGHIDSHLEQAPGLAELSQIAGVSPFHFHRQFRALFGLTLGAYVRQQRLKKAGHRLALRQDKVIDIALAAGFESPEAFARAFRQHTGKSPLAFRKNPDWHWLQAPQRRTLMTSPTPGQVELVDFPETSIAALHHQGPPAQILATVNRFIAWRRENRLPPARSRTFNILHDDPEQVPAKHFRFTLCCEAPHPIAPNDLGVVAATLPARRCARLRHQGPDSRLRESFDHLYGQWLPTSGYQGADAPPFLERIRHYPDVPEQDSLIDIYLPLARSAKVE